MTNTPPSPPDDDVRRARAGDHTAIARILARYRARLERVIEARSTPKLRSQTRGSDILQSVFVQVLTSMKSFRGDTADECAAWLVRIAENKVRDANRRFDAAKRRGATALTHDPEDPRTRSGGMGAPSSPLTNEEEIRVFATAFSRLKPEYQRVISLRVGKQMTHAEIAVEMERTEEAIRKLFQRAAASFLAETERVRDETKGS